MVNETEQKNQYVVLARKYRPQTFEELLGQDVLVQTLTNALKNNRLHHAYILTGIRGVGKTTTARLIARALNCTGLDGQSGPTMHPCGACENCKAIAAGRHIDVMELDAASRTGVDDMRELLDGVRYKPTNARYKIYIIDEVHMLSKGAFNALLKTLEEPPAHVKFIFATTEIRKVPVTILSRCQRFDLQRLNIDTLLTLFNKVLTAEQIEADPEALQIVARAADGSARDGLSLLDQAIVLGNGKVKTDSVISMIGLADRSQTLELFEHLLKGDMADVLEVLHRQYQDGAAPMIILQDLISIAHMLAKAKIVPSIVNTETLGESDRALCQRLAGSVSIATLSRLWQMMIKGLSELNLAPMPLEALEMILIRVAYAANMPTPAEILNDVKKNSNLGVNILKSTAPDSIPSRAFVPQEQKQATNPTLASVRETPPVSGNLSAPAELKPIKTPCTQPADSQAEKNCPFHCAEDFAAYLEAQKKMLLLYAFKNDVSIEEFSSGHITMAISDKAHPDFLQNLQHALEEATGFTWQTDIRRGPLGETLADKEQSALEADKKSISEYPLVKAVLSEFKGAKIDTLWRTALPEESDDKSESEEDAENENLNITYDEEE